MVSTSDQNGTRRSRVYVVLLTGEPVDAERFVGDRYPGRECLILSKLELRNGGWRGQIRAFRNLEGEALVFFAKRWTELVEPQLMVCSSVFHRCRFTVLADATGRAAEYGRFRQLYLLPAALASACCDALVFVASWLLIRLFLINARPVRPKDKADLDLDLAYLYPYPLDSALAGGAVSHIEGFLSGVAASRSSCKVFSGRPFSFGSIPVHPVPSRRRMFLFRESLMLSYNLRFAMQVRKMLRASEARALYQRHGRFVVAGALLSRWLGVPLVLEYNGSETWLADFWDPARFRSWLRLCEEVSLSRAHLIVVVSEVLRQDLVRRGIPEDRILVSPNAVDPAVFHPDCGGPELRRQLGFNESDIVVSFVGTFSHWHGVEVLGGAIRQLLQEQSGADEIPGRLRFLLIGEGPLYAETRRGLESLPSQVLFTGLLPHSQIPAHLDAADILVSPHVPMPDGRPFFGSPTKLFEYMAMGKAIIASNLDQLAHVLSHGQSAWLVEPGNVAELASAILLLARNQELRGRLGLTARASAIADHTWKQNAERVLHRVRNPAADGTVSRPARARVA